MKLKLGLFGDFIFILKKTKEEQTFEYKRYLVRLRIMDINVLAIIL